MSNIEPLGEELKKVKRDFPEFSYIRTTRRAREPEFYKLYIRDELIGELWDNQEGHLWTNLVSEEEKANAPLLERGKTLQNPSTQKDVLYVKQTNATGGFKCAMSFSSVSKTYDVMKSMIMTYRGKGTPLSSRKYKANAMKIDVPTKTMLRKEPNNMSDKIAKEAKISQKNNSGKIKKKRVL